MRHFRLLQLRGDRDQKFAHSGRRSGRVITSLSPVSSFCRVPTLPPLSLPLRSPSPPDTFSVLIFRASFLNFTPLSFLCSRRFGFSDFRVFDVPPTIYRGGNPFMNSRIPRLPRIFMRTRFFILFSILSSISSNCRRFTIFIIPKLRPWSSLENHASGSLGSRERAKLNASRPRSPTTAGVVSSNWSATG